MGRLAHRFQIVRKARVAPHQGHGDEPRPRVNQRIEIADHDPVVTDPTGFYYGTGTIYCIGDVCTGSLQTVYIQNSPLPPLNGTEQSYNGDAISPGGGTNTSGSAAGNGAASNASSSVPDLPTVTVTAPKEPSTPPPTLLSVALQSLQHFWQSTEHALCEGGNVLVSKAAQLGPFGTHLEQVGLAATVVSVMAQPEVNPAAGVVVGAGVATTGTGAAVSTLANVFQEFGGIAQMVGSNDSSVGRANAMAGADGLLIGSAISWAGGSSRATGFTSAATDTATGYVPGMSPMQADCGG